MPWNPSKLVATSEVQIFDTAGVVVEVLELQRELVLAD